MPGENRRLFPDVTGLVRAAILILAGTAGPAHAWVYPEHRDIAVLAVGQLDPERRALFEEYWEAARTGREGRLCEAAADTAQGLAPGCIDWAALPAIAGDHSCSSEEMLGNALDSDWILEVADVAARLKVDLAKIPVTPPVERTRGDYDFVGDARRRMQDQALRAERINSLRTADTHLQRADVDYATRAGSSNAHFLLARPRPDITGKEYAQLTLTPGSEISAVGVYAWIHLSALQKATRLATEDLESAERQALARAMLADEAFALHFLEDAYAAGHVAGTWGDVSQRKGTHDYYNEAGLEAFTWERSGQSVVLMGDAHMRPEDAQITAAAVRASLEQVIDHASGRDVPSRIPYAAAAPGAPDPFDVCQSTLMPQRDPGQQATPEAFVQAVEVLRTTPVPGLSPGLGAMPRFRAEVGPFLGFAGSMEARTVDGGYVPEVADDGAIFGADLSFRAGLGLDGVLGQSGDGLVFASIGLHGNTDSTNDLPDSSSGVSAAGGVAAVRSRFGISTRVRMPFYLVPGDLLLLSPMYFFSPDAYTGIAVTASNGGLIPWQNGWETRIGRFQFVLGRELGATFYGYGLENSTVVPGVPPDGEPTVVDYKSVYFDLPVLEFRPYRAFDTKQSSAILVQLFAGADVTQSTTVTWPVGAPGVELDTIYSFGVRLIFDWRRYY